MEANPDALEWLIVQNSNAYEVGFSPAWAGLHMLWKTRSEETEAPLRALLARETIKTIYLHGVESSGAREPGRVGVGHRASATAARGAPAPSISSTTTARTCRCYPRWQAFLRERQPETLIFWGQGDIFFTPGRRRCLPRRPSVRRDAPARRGTFRRRRAPRLRREAHRAFLLEPRRLDEAEPRRLGPRQPA